jgi:hypothetical protein
VKFASRRAHRASGLSVLSPGPADFSRERDGFSETHDPHAQLYTAYRTERVDKTSNLPVFYRAAIAAFVRLYVA